MEMFAGKAEKIFRRAIEDYHRLDRIDQPAPDPYPDGSFDAMLYRKCWIDTVQWHLEDIIRDPLIRPAEALEIKRRIDRSNQQRTDTVELIDCRFLEEYRAVEPLPGAGINTETPAWALDRLSILALKIYHMERETLRKDLAEPDLELRREKLETLLHQREDLSAAIDELLDDIAAGRKRMKLYRQMKMYNDPSFNPVLYAQGMKDDK